MADFSLGQVGEPDLTDQEKYDNLTSAYRSGFSMDMPIEYGKPTPPIKGAYLPGGSSDAQAEAFRRAVSGSPAPVTRAGDLMNQVALWNQKNPEMYGKLQQDLYLAGFYGKTKIENIAIGQLDDQSLGAFSDLLARTARLNQALLESGQPTLTWQEVLAQGVGTFSDIMKGINSGSGGQAKSVIFSDPAGLSTALDQLAQNILGRKAKPDEQRMFVSLIHGMESSYQLSDTGGTRPDVQGQGEQLLRQQAPVEAKAHDFRNVFDVFAKMVGGGA